MIKLRLFSTLKDKSLLNKSNILKRLRENNKQKIIDELKKTKLLKMMKEKYINKKLFLLNRLAHQSEVSKNKQVMELFLLKTLYKKM